MASGGQSGAGPVQERIKRLTKKADLASQLTAMVTEQNSSDEEAKQMLDAINLETLAREIPFARVMVEIAKYEGFNPREMAAILLSSHKAYREKIRNGSLQKETIEEIVKIGQEEKEFKFSNDEEFRIDIQFIDIVFLTRGAVFDKIKGKSGDAMKRIMDMMKAKYNINTRKRKPGTTLDAKTVTIPRIAASFPQITVELFNSGIGRSLVNPHSIFPAVEKRFIIFQEHYFPQ